MKTVLWKDWLNPETLGQNFLLKKKKKVKIDKLQNKWKQPQKKKLKIIFKSKLQCAKKPLKIIMKHTYLRRKINARNQHKKE